MSSAGLSGNHVVCRNQATVSTQPLIHRPRMVKFCSGCLALTHLNWTTSRQGDPLRRQLSHEDGLSRNFSTSVCLVLLALYWSYLDPAVPRDALALSITMRKLLIWSLVPLPVLKLALFIRVSNPGSWFLLEWFLTLLYWGWNQRNCYATAVIMANKQWCK